MHLQPRRERGRSDRKVASYASEILRLRGEGYTFEAIREALIDVGIDISEATLRREVRRQHRPSSPTNSGTAPASDTSTDSTVPPMLVTSLAPSSRTGSSGREVAEAFFSANPSNPLLRTKERP